MRLLCKSPTLRKGFLLDLPHMHVLVRQSALRLCMAQDTGYRPLHPIDTSNGHQPDSPRFLGASPLADGASTLHTITTPRATSLRGETMARSRPGTHGGSAPTIGTDRRSQHGMGNGHWTTPVLSTTRGSYNPGPHSAGPAAGSRAVTYAPGTRGHGSPTKRAHWYEASLRHARTANPY